MIFICQSLLFAVAIRSIFRLLQNVLLMEFMKLVVVTRVEKDGWLHVSLAAESAHSLPIQILDYFFLIHYILV